MYNPAMPSPRPHDAAPVPLPRADWLRRDMLAVHALFAALLIAVLPFSGLPVAGIFSFGACCLYGVYILLVMPQLICRYFLFWVQAVLNLLGVLACEYTVTELTELQCMSGFAGSLPLLAFSWWCFFAVLWLIDGRTGGSSRPFAEPPETVRTLIDLLATAAVLLAALVLFQTATTAAPAVALGVDRFEYARNFSAVPSQIITLLRCLMFVSVLAIRFGKRGVGVAGVALYVVYLYWIGTKFGGYLQVVATFLLVYADKISADDVSRAAAAIKKNLLTALIVLAAIVAFAVWYQTSVSDLGVAEYLSSRLAQQGQLWWGTFELWRDGALDRDLSVELAGLFDDGSTEEMVGARHGIYGIMYLCAPQDVIDAKLARGSTYTAVGHAVMLSYFGSVGCVAYSLAAAALVAAVTRGLTHPVDDWQVFSIVLWGRLYFLVSSAFSMFDFAAFVSAFSLASYAVLICVWLLRLDGALRERGASPGHAAAALSGAGAHGV